MRVKDTVTADFEAHIRNLERELALKSIPPEPSVPKLVYEKLEEDLRITRKQIEGLTIEVAQRSIKSSFCSFFLSFLQNQSKENLISKLEQDICLIKKFHDEQLQEHIQTAAQQAEQLQSEIRSLKRLCDDKTAEVLVFVNVCSHFPRFVCQGRQAKSRNSFLSRSSVD